MIYLRSPVRSSPGPARPDGSGLPWAFPRAMQRFVTETAHWGGDEWNTHSCSRCYALNHSYEATSCRTAPYVIMAENRGEMCSGIRQSFRLGRPQEKARAAHCAFSLGHPTRPVPEGEGEPSFSLARGSPG
jgi:hypothetical protein